MFECLIDQSRHRRGTLPTVISQQVGYTNRTNLAKDPTLIGMID